MAQYAALANSNNISTKDKDAYVRKYVETLNNFEKEKEEEKKGVEITH